MVCYVRHLACPKDNQTSPLFVKSNILSVFIDKIAYTKFTLCSFVLSQKIQKLGNKINKNVN